MDKIARSVLVGFIIIFYLNACTTKRSELNLNEMSVERLSLRITELNDKLVALQEQTNDLIEKVDKYEIINPIDIDGQQLYVNNLLPLAIRVSNDYDLPIVVYKYGPSVELFFEEEDIKEFIQGYALVPRLIVKDNKLDPDPEFYDKKQIVKEVDEDWVIIKNIRIETSIDEQTNQKINEMLEKIKFYQFLGYFNNDLRLKASILVDAFY